MFTSNPFAVLSSSIAPAVIQAYVAVMIFLVVAGTLFDVMHKRSATYFFNNWRNSKTKARRRVGAVGMVSIAAQTAVVDVIASGEFCNMQRRIAHLLTMYGFVLYVVTTAVMVFAYPMPTGFTPIVLPILWYLGALLICGGGYWFWFFIRVDIAAEGNPQLRFVRADLFVVALVLSASFGVVWASLALATGNSVAAYVFLALYLVATTVLFGSIPWSKFSHMFFKPAAALEKRVAEANGTRSNLPAPADARSVLGSVPRYSGHY